MTGSVYFAQEGGGGAIKIGWTSKDVRLRFTKLQSDNSKVLIRLGVIPNATREVEAAWHLRFLALRLRAEWFHPAPELLAAIAAEAKPVPASAKPRVARITDSGFPVLDRFRRGLVTREFSLKQFSELSGIAMPTLSNMSSPSWPSRTLDNLKRIECALKQLDAQRHPQPPQTRELQGAA